MKLTLDLMTTLLLLAILAANLFLWAVIAGG